jgi:hypothetical protein
MSWNPFYRLIPARHRGREFSDYDLAIADLEIGNRDLIGVGVEKAAATAAGATE